MIKLDYTESVLHVLSLQAINLYAKRPLNICVD